VQRIIHDSFSNVPFSSFEKSFSISALAILVFAAFAAIRDRHNVFPSDVLCQANSWDEPLDLCVPAGVVL
jgi:hypothetical protein